VRPNVRDDAIRPVGNQEVTECGVAGLPSNGWVEFGGAGRKASGAVKEATIYRGWTTRFMIQTSLERAPGP
jgi:hypothetical protein